MAQFTNDFSIKITKKTTLQKWCNDMSTGEKLLIHGRILNADKTRCYKFRFVLWIDGFDYAEWLEDCGYKNTQANYKEYIEECIFGYTQLITGYSPDGVREFFRVCQDTIDDYNSKLKYCY